jgi:hypothetical protein
LLGWLVVLLLHQLHKPCLTLASLLVLLQRHPAVLLHQQAWQELGQQLACNNQKSQSQQCLCMARISCWCSGKQNQPPANPEPCYEAACRMQLVLNNLT